MKQEHPGQRTGRRARPLADRLIPSGSPAGPTRTIARCVRIEDIAHALAGICCLAGQTRAFYSRAQHNYLASMIVPPEDALAALFLDTEHTLEDLLPECLRVKDPTPRTFSSSSASRPYA